MTEVKPYKEELTPIEKEKITELVNGLSKAELNYVIGAINERLLNTYANGTDR